jgi:hypothetical protein
MSEFLGHPMVLLLTGAVLTGFLLPMIARVSQDRQKELEIKVGLVSELSETIMKIIMAVQFAQHVIKQPIPFDISKEQENLNNAYRDWEIESAIIGTKLKAYFLKSKIPDDWETFSEIIKNAYALQGRVAGGFDTMALVNLQELMGLKNEHPQWESLRDMIMERKSMLIQAILKEKTIIANSDWLSNGGETT